MARCARVNFVRQQGFRGADTSTCEGRYPALLFQPRLIGLLVVTGLALQSWLFFAILAGILWWNVVLPAWNPFDALYNRLAVRGTGRPPLTPAPPPRRFAQGMAGSFMAAIAVFLFLGWQLAMWIVAGLLIAALSALIVGKFCLGSYIFHAIRGDAAFANQTLPWAPETAERPASVA
jgi:hypothetical protein